MADDLAYLVSKMAVLRERYKTGVKKAARRIRLRDIVAATKSQPSLPADIAAQRQYSFNLGDQISFLLEQGHISVYVDPGRLRLRGHDLLLREFSGSQVRSFYNYLATSVQGCVTEHNESLPF